jgi:hypothetical protein
LIRLRLGVVLALAVAVGALCHAPKAMAAAEVHRVNLVISAIPSNVKGGGINTLLERYNEYPVEARGLSPVDKIGMGWTFDAELRYFVRPNFAIAAGVGQLKAASEKEFLPRIGTSINIREEILTVPIHVGAQYYLAPYTQGDFQARAYLGGGLMSLAATRAQFTTYESGIPLKNTTDPNAADTLDIASLGGNNRLTATGGAPGYYLEAGAHMFFAARYSVIIGAIYRSMKLRAPDNVGHVTVPQPNLIPGFQNYLPMELTYLDGTPVYFPDVDLSGLGLRAALAIGF